MRARHVNDASARSWPVVFRRGFRLLAAGAILVVLTIGWFPNAGTRPVQAASRQPVRGQHGMVSTSEPFASEVGVEILKRGGNAVDAAVAVAFALAVTHPAAGNLGGGGFMMIRLADGKYECIDYRETAPQAASRDMYLDANGKVTDRSLKGYAASGVPGTVAGLALAHKKFGKLPWSAVIEPARRLAQNGFPVSYSLARSFKSERLLLGAFDESRRIFLRDGKFFEEGERFRQPELAATLARIQRFGAQDFYRGRTARLIAREMSEHGGTITLEDLKAYRPVERDPLHGTYRGYEIVTMPPPSSGGIALIEMLNMIESYDLAKMGNDSSEKYHFLIESMRRAFADRAQFLGDPGFVRIPVKGLVAKSYAKELVSTIDAEKATASSAVRNASPLGFESEETTHFSIVDAEGNAVSNTYTLNGGYGSGVTVEGAGFLLNNEMDDFAAKVGVPNAYGLIQGEGNSVQPGKRPLSSMTPTFVLKDGKLLLVVGSPGGPTIINTVLQVIVNVIDHRMNVQQAIDAPRLHHQWLPDVVRWEPFGISSDTMRALASRGYSFAEKPGNIGDAQAIMIDPGTGVRLGAADSRASGKSVGY